MHASCNSVDRRTNMARLKVQDQKMENQIRSKAIVRSVFSLSRALFRKKCGAIPHIRTNTARLNSHDTHSDRMTWANRCASKQDCMSITSWQYLTLCDSSAPHKNIFLFFHLFPACCYVAKICPSSCGGPCLWGPMFGRTC